jgi:hypothetical protein
MTTDAAEYEGQGTGAEGVPDTPEFDPSSAMVDVPGRGQMPVSEVVNALKNSEAKMHEATTKAAAYGWADAIKERYDSDPSFQNSFHDLWDGRQQQQAAGTVNQQPARTNPLDPMMQQFNEQARIVEELKMDREFDRLRTEGKEIGQAEEVEIAKVIATNPAVRDIRAAYLLLYADRDLKAAAEGAAAKTADDMASGRAAYKAPPKSGAVASGPSKKPDVGNMTPQQFQQEVIQKLAQAGQDNW